MPPRSQTGAPRAINANEILAQLSEGFDDFRTRSYGRLATIEAEIERMARQDAGRQVPGGGGRAGSAALAEFGRFALHGPQAAMSIGSGPDGGYIVAPELDRVISSRLADVSPLRELAEVVQTKSSPFERVIGTSAPAAEWVAETAARPDTETPDIAKVSIPAHELYANAPVTQALLEDALDDVGDFVIRQIAEKFADKEGAAFVAGTGTGQPLGFLACPRAATSDATRAQGTLQTVNSGAAAAVTVDGLLGLLYALRAGYRRNATWLMSSGTARLVMSLKDTTDRPIWTDALAAGQPPTLLGRPVALDENMPAVAAGAASIALGDWKRGYLICDRIGTTVLRDPYTNAPYVNFKVRKRVGGAVVDDDAIKLQLIAA